MAFAETATFGSNAARMKSRKSALLVFAAGALLCVSAVAQSVAVNQKIIDEALKPSPIEANLRRLTDEIGGRVPGTPAMDRAVQWGVNAFKAAGADDVHTEEFTLPAGWEEGPTTLDVDGDWKTGGGVHFRTRVTAIAWTPPLIVRTRVRLVSVGYGSEKDFANAGDVKGAFVLVNSHVLKTWDDLFNEYLDAPPVVERAVKAGALAIVWTSTRERDLLYRHINTLTGRIDRIPQVLMAREDAERLSRLLASGLKIDVQAFNMPNATSGTIKSKNVVAELRGSEHPEEWVLIGAHLDSWELGTGALDNGCNAALVIDALRAIKAAGVRPKRSIRFALFSGEEQGMLGSWAYTAQHKAELDRALMAIIFDEGTGPATGFSLGGRNDLRPAIQSLLAPYAQWGVTMLTDDAPVGTDNFDFLLEGVPNLIANQQEANYIANYHATSDTFDKVDLPQLKKHVALAAGVAVAIADAPQRPGPRQTRAQIEALMGPTHLEEQMKIFGMWDDWSSGKRGRKD